MKILNLSCGLENKDMFKRIISWFSKKEEEGVVTGYTVDLYYNPYTQGLVDEIREVVFSDKVPNVRLTYAAVKELY